MIKPTLTSLLNINQLIIAPMFLVSNTKMVIEGMKAGVAAVFHKLPDIRGIARFHYRT
jgi:hypothetical protein